MIHDNLNANRNILLADDNLRKRRNVAKSAFGFYQSVSFCAFSRLENVKPPSTEPSFGLNTSLNTFPFILIRPYFVGFNHLLD